MAIKKTNEVRQRAIEELGDRMIGVSRLHLNLRNPRHEPAESESEAISKLCDSELIAELAQDIARRGSLSPLEVFGVVPMAGHPDHFVSLEGNRRTCALIVANDPNRAPKSIRPQLERIAASADLPKQVKAHVFSTEAEAKQWIDLRHLGQQGGAGTKSWGPTQQYRAAGANAQTTARDNTLAVRVLDHLVESELLSPEERNKTNVTTLTRYLGTPGVRAIFGLKSNKALIYTHDPREVDQTLLRLVRDSITPLEDGSYRVNSRSNSPDRVRYANELKGQDLTPTTELDEPEEPPPLKNGRSQPKKASTKKHSANHPDTRKKLIPTDFSISLQDPVLLRLRREGLNLNLDDFTFSANYILRALVEHVMTLFAKKLGGGKWRENMTDRALAQLCAVQLRNLDVERKPVRVVNKSSDDTTGYGLHSLGHAVHGGSIPTATDLKRQFDTWRPALEAMLDALEEKTGK